MKIKIIAAFFLALLYSANVSAQNTEQNTEQNTAPNLETILSESQKQTEFYKETFRNLLADETKTFEEFDKSGNSDEKTIVKSTFLVYQSGRNEKVTTELRNVLEVNGKPVPNSQKRSNDFLAELAKESTLEKELQKIQKESARYDKTIEVFGYTLYEGVVLAPNMRPYFDYQLGGTEDYQGSEVFVINYRQTKESPYSVVNGDKKYSSEAAVSFDVDLPDAFKDEDVFLRGKIWVDAKTYQIRREEQELFINTADQPVLLTTSFEYQNSNYGILIPKTIAVVFNELKKIKGTNKFAAQKDVSLRFDYANYRQTDVEVRILDDVE